jgi:hypothetical protein
LQRLNRRVSAWLIVVCVLASSLSARAQEIPVPLRAAILLRALRYEKGFASGTSPAQLFVLGGRDGAEAAKVADALSQLAAADASGRKVVVSKLDRDPTLDELRAKAPAVIYVPSGAEATLSLVKSLASSIVLCGNPVHVGKGCMLSVEPFGQSSRLVIDLAEAERKGLRFDARMLRLARVIR